MSETSQEPYVGPLAADLIRAVFGPAAVDRVDYVDYSQARGDLAVRFNDPWVVDSDRAGASDLVDRLVTDGSWVNLDLNHRAAGLSGGLHRPWAGRSIAVEHTSVVPVYPINVWSARGSILGEMTRRSASLLGAKAVGHFWFEETARQRQVTRIPKDWRLGERDKADHEAAVAFFTGLARELDESAEWLDARLGLMDAGVPPEGIGDRFLTHADDSIIAEGYQETLKMLGIVGVHFDFQADIERRVNLADISQRLRSDGSDDAVRMATAIARKDDWNYAVRNFVYFALLLQENHEVISVVSVNQLRTIAPVVALASRAFSSESKRASVRPFGSVTVDGTRDKVKDGYFHTVDRYLVDDRIRQRFIRDVGSRGLEVPIHLDRNPRSSRARPVERHIRHPAVAAALAVDELPGLLQRAVDLGRFASLVTWNRAVSGFVQTLSGPIRADLLGAQRELSFIDGVVAE